jgi:uncharacterized membrane protein
MLTVAVAAGLVRSQYCQFTWGKMALHDYGIYFNMLWNTAHGDWFTYLTDQSYLRTHLSFSLVLLAPLFRLWDDPLLLTVIQWCCLLIGGLLFWRILFLSGVSGFTSAAFLLLSLHPGRHDVRIPRRSPLLHPRPLVVSLPGLP